MKCQRCQYDDAEWAAQDIAGDLQIATLGSHERGFRMLKICADCAAEIRADAEPLERFRSAYRAWARTRQTRRPPELISHIEYHVLSRCEYYQFPDPIRDRLMVEHMVERELLHYNQATQKLELTHIARKALRAFEKKTNP